MSTRNIRKFQGGNNLPPPDEENNYEPLYATTEGAVNKYVGLSASSGSESDPLPASSESEEEVKLTPKQRRKKKQMRRKQRKQADKFQMDEIDKSLQEVNKLLGAPAPAPAAPPALPPDPEDVLFAVSSRNLNPAAELRRFLGPEPKEDAEKRRVGRNQLYSLRKGLIIPMEIGDLSKFRRVGLSMSMIHNKEDGCNYFRIDHDEFYRQNVKAFLHSALTSRDEFPDIDPTAIRENFYMEQYLQLIDIYFALEDYDKIKKSLDLMVSYLQYISHPMFTLTVRKNRLEYRVLENRLFFVTLLKYIYILTNSACHRTALEITKGLMNLDPTDPLALIILVDILALRSREFQWLVDVVDHWKVVRDADFMFNLLYSSALAQFHVIRKQKGDIKIADDSLKYAMKRYPNVVSYIYKATCNRHEIIDTCPMFKETAKMPEVLREIWHDLLKYYSHSTAINFRERHVWPWFERNVIEMAEEYDNDSTVREFVADFAIVRATMRCLPHQIVRHFQVIKFMHPFIFDEQLLGIRSGLAAYNPEPYPTDTLNRYGYRFVPLQPTYSHRRSNLLGEFVRSLAPEFVARLYAADENEDAAR